MTLTKIFVTGATGYIGGTIVDRLIKHPEFKSFEITCLVRKPDQAEKLQTLGLKTVTGDYSSLDVLTEASSDADVVFAMARPSSDDYPAAKAILDGLKKRFEKTGTPPVLIHTTGTAFAVELVNGMHDKVNKVYNDLDSASIEAIPADGIHRNVDIPLVQADKEGYVRVYLMAPGVIFGVPKGALVDLGIQQKKSIAISALFEASVDRKRAGYIGGGKNVWPAVSLRDVAALYLLAFDTARENPEALGHGRDGFYIAENCEWRPLEMMTAAGKILVEYGIADGAEPTPFSKEEEIKYFGTFAPLLASNCGARGDRSRTLGWTPVDGKEELLQSVREGLLLHLPQEKKQ